MTDEELKQYIVGLGTSIESLARTQAETQAETSEQIRELRASQDQTDQQIRAGQAEIRELRASQDQTDQQIRAGQAEIRELRALQKQTTKQLGELGNRFGGFTEGMALPSVREILYETFGVDTVVTDARARRNGHSLQIDAVGVANGEVNAAYIVEIKSRLREESLQQILKHLERFVEFFPEHRGKTLYGLLAAVDVAEDLEQRVLGQGIYLAKIHGDLFELVRPEGFAPRRFPS